MRSLYFSDFKIQDQLLWFLDPFQRSLEIPHSFRLLQNSDFKTVTNIFWVDFNLFHGEIILPPTQSQEELGKSIAILFLQFWHLTPVCSAAMPILQTLFKLLFVLATWMFINQVTFTNYFSSISAPGSHAAGLMLEK